MVPTTFKRHQSYRSSIVIIVIVLLVGHLLLLPHKAIAIDLPDTYGNRMAAAERYLQVVSMKDMMHNTIIETAKNVPEEYRSLYIQLMTKHINVPVIERAALASMTKNFTVEELDALATFYGSKVGQSAMGKFGAYMGDLMPALQQEIIKTQESMRSELEAAITKERQK